MLSISSCAPIICGADPQCPSGETDILLRALREFMKPYNKRHSADKSILPLLRPAVPILPESDRIIASLPGRSRTPRQAMRFSHKPGPDLADQGDVLRIDLLHRVRQLSVIKAFHHALAVV